MDLLNLIERHKNNFSKTEAKVYDYIINHPETVETYTITKIANESNTSTSAVLRFCQVLGFNGYKDFRFEMIKYLRDHYEGKDSTDYFNQLTNEYVKTIGQFQNLDRSLIEQLITALKQKKPLYIMGLHYSAAPARQLKLGLQTLGIMSYSAYDNIEATHLASTINDDATLILFSFSGNKSNFNNSLLALDTLPKQAYLITLNPNAKIASAFNHTLVLPSNPLTSQSVIDSQSIAMIFVEILLNLLHNSL